MYIYYPFPGLEDHPIYFQRWTVRVIKYFWGSIGFFARGEKNSIDPLSAGNRSVFEGGTPLGGSPPKRGGPPLGGVPPLLSKTDFFEKFEKEDALSRPYAHFWAQKPCFWGGTQKGRFWPFLGVLGGTPGVPPKWGRSDPKSDRPP